MVSLAGLQMTNVSQTSIGYLRDNGRSVSTHAEKSATRRASQLVRSTSHARRNFHTANFKCDYFSCNGACQSFFEEKMLVTFSAKTLLLESH